MSEPASATSTGLSLAPFQGLRFTADKSRLGQLLCPPYDVIDDAARQALIAQDPDNVVRIVLPEFDASRDNATDADGDQYEAAATLLASWVTDGVVAVDDTPTLYIYEMSTPAGADADPDSSGAVTRGLLGAVELRDPQDGVILPHENTMAGPVADRLALMEATQANLEPIYLVYDGGGAASELVASVDAALVPAASAAGAATPATPADQTGPSRAPATDTPADLTATDRAAEDAAPASRAQFVTSAVTPDGTHHRLWAVTDPETLADVAADLGSRHALIADGHHRYATYRQLAERRHPTGGAGPWDRGLALLVDSSAYGPQVHPIHRTVPSLSFGEALSRASNDFDISDSMELDAALANLDDPEATAADRFAAVVTDGQRAVIISNPQADVVTAARSADESAALSALDVWVLHRVLIERTWGLLDDEHTVLYAHSVPEALAAVAGGIAVLLRPTPVAAVAGVAAAGARMPRKSTLFTPKPASGLVMRRFVDQA